MEEHLLTEMPKRYPIDGTFELTVRCNLHCKMCLFRHDDSENAEIIGKELTTEQWIDMAKQAAEAGTLNLLITGGEPMLRPDFCEIWEKINQFGFFLQLYTNATLVTPEVMAVLKKYPPHVIGITVYGSTPEIYEKVTGCGEAFYKMCSGVQELMTLPSAIQFRTTIIKDNFEDVRNIENLISEKFHWNGIVNEPRCVLPPVRGGASKACEVRLEPEDNVKLMFRRGIDYVKEQIGERKFDINNLEVRAIPKQKEENKKTQFSFTLFGCDAGMKSYTISWNGKLLGCQTLGDFQTDALHDGLKKAWKDFPFTVKFPELNEKCSNCSIARYCETCYASRLAETGSLNGWPEYQCRDAHEIARLVNGGKFYEKV